VDVKEGVQEQSRRHAYLLGFLGVKQVAVVASKMDLVDYAEAIFDRVRDDCSAVIRGLDIRPAAFIPVSATDGENVVTRSPPTPWRRRGSPSTTPSSCSAETSSAIRCTPRGSPTFSPRMSSGSAAHRCH